MKKYKYNVSWIVQVSLLSALAIILYNFPKFKLPFFPGMLSVQFSMLPTIIGSFALGPFGGVLIVVIKFLFKLLTTSTAGVGEIVGNIENCTLNIPGKNGNLNFGKLYKIIASADNKLT